MKWQQIVPLVIVLAGAALLIWRSSGKKAGGCGCKCGCAHEPDAGHKKPDAAR